MGVKMSVAMPHRRYNMLTGEWILVSPHRTQRPWQGAQDAVVDTARIQHDPTCYLCPGVERVSGERNPDYTETFVFTNDFQAILAENPESSVSDGFFQQQAVSGTCRVICFSPRHDLTMAQMQLADIERVIITWQQQYKELIQQYVWVQIFENKGAMMGCSNPHPHGQIWASDFMPQQIEREHLQQDKYFSQHNRVLLLDYLAEELAVAERVVVANDDWVVVVPFWALWPYETLLLPRQHLPDIACMDAKLRHSLADILQQILQKYDKLFNCDMPYSMGWHFAPNLEGAAEFWQLHAHFYPPLLRSSTVKKFMVGYELLAEPQRDITAEQAADILRGL